MSSMSWMNRNICAGCTAILTVAALLWMGTASPAGAQSTGGIKGHVRLSGKLPGNSIIRMNVDPKCAEINRGKRVIQETVKTASDGSLANAFIRLDGTFPKTPLPSAPVTIDQLGCVYSPRVVGVQVGQTLQIRNSDPLLHNVHSNSRHNNQFNFGQAKAGVVDSFKLKEPEVMLRLGCDVHRWMHAYIGVVTNPYYAVSDGLGNFQISNIPPGTYTIHSWHERYGPVSKRVTVVAGKMVSVDFTYTGSEPEPTARAIQDSRSSE